MIVVNARFLTQPLTGVQRYAREISRRLRSLDRDIVFVTPGGVTDAPFAHELQAIVTGSMRGHAWEQIDLPLWLARRGSPLLLCLGTAAPVFYRKKIVTIHDLAFRHHPEAVSSSFRLLYNTLIPRVASTSLHLTTVSEFSKQDICRTFALPRDFVTVVPNASSFPIAPRSDQSDVETTIVAVGSLQPYKNLESLIKGFIAFNAQRNGRFTLKVVGSVDQAVFRGSRVSALTSGRHDIVLTGRLSDSELKGLYSSATCFAFPSLFEGFGIPPLEAMSCGCPVIASNATSIPEVCGDAALYFEPRDVPDIAAKLAMVADSPELRLELARRGYANARRFNWDESARRILEIARGFDGPSFTLPPAVV